mgnify:FL=1|jgi:hypothetical protein
MAGTTSTCVLHPVSISADCKTITYTISGAGSYNIVIIAPDLTEYTDTLPTTAGSGTGTFLTVLADSQHGVYSIQATDSDTEHVCKGAVLSACNLDCCIVKKTNELLDCACDCEKCSALLAQTQKIFLMKQAAEYNLERYNAKTGGYNVAYLSTAQAMYNKIFTICNDTCGCNC